MFYPVDGGQGGLAGLEISTCPVAQASDAQSPRRVSKLLGQVQILAFLLHLLKALSQWQVLSKLSFHACPGRMGGKGYGGGGVGEVNKENPLGFPRCWDTGETESSLQHCIIFILCTTEIEQQGGSWEYLKEGEAEIPVPLPPLSHYPVSSVKCFVPHTNWEKTVEVDLQFLNLGQRDRRRRRRRRRGGGGGVALVVVNKFKLYYVL